MATTQSHFEKLSAKLNALKHERDDATTLDERLQMQALIEYVRACRDMEDLQSYMPMSTLMRARFDEVTTLCTAGLRADVLAEFSYERERWDREPSVQANAVFKSLDRLGVKLSDTDPLVCPGCLSENDYMCVAGCKDHRPVDHRVRRSVLLQTAAANARATRRT
jgi:hypothetical protein